MIEATSDYLDFLHEQDPRLYEIEMRGAEHEHMPGGPLVVERAKSGVMPLDVTCSTRFKAVHSSGRRELSEILWIVLHDTESLTAASAASWFENTKSKGSANFCLDAAICYRTLAPTEIPWAAPGANVNGLHFEMAGFAHWTRTEWLAHHGTIHRAAYRAAYWAGALGIPPKLLTDKQLAGRKTKGFITHRQVSRVFRGSDHTDPGERFPLDVFMKDVRSFTV
jgi:hypothetical protein